MNSLVSRSGNLFDELLRDVTSGFYVRPLHGEPLPSKIRVDVKDGEKAYIVQAELAGVSKDDIHVAIDGSVVTLRAEVRQQDSQERDGQALRSERYYGAVSRSLQLPVEIDAAQAKAKYENGILTLTLPKKIGGSGQRLAIE